MWLFGGLAALAAGGYAYSWKNNSDLTRDLTALRNDMQTAIAKTNENAQKTASAVSDRADRLVDELKGEIARDHAELEREMASHTLEDARTYATQKNLAEVESRLFGVLAQVRGDIGLVNTKLDRVIERNNAVDRS